MDKTPSPFPGWVIKVPGLIMRMRVNVVGGGDDDVEWRKKGHLTHISSSCFTLSQANVPDPVGSGPFRLDPDPDSGLQI
jgi:hypothetical protein